MNSEYLTISGRFCGPPNSGNGGYVCGLTARNLPGTVTVRLKLPPPLDTPMRLEWTDESARLFQDSTVVAEARASELRLEVPQRPSLAQAALAAKGYPGLAEHPFPRCFVCGPAREPADGLRIFPGPVHGQSIHAAPWVPDASLADAQHQVAPEFIWSALDCPSGFAVLPLPQGMAIVLGELTASIVGTVTAGRAYVLTSWPIAHEGRRRTAGAAIHDEDGILVASARAVWIEVPRDQWAPAS